MIPKGLLVHTGIFVVASTLALHAWTRGEDKSKQDATIEIWGGAPTTIQRIEFENNKRKVTLEAQSDDNGQYFVGTLLRAKAAKSDAPPNPHQPAPTTPDLNDAKAEKETVRFVGVTESKALSEKLAPMKALRLLGKFDEKRLPEFGFDQDHGTMRVTVSGKTHQLALGGDTPGGTDSYARDLDSGEGYVISGGITQPLQQAESRLIERDLHAFTMDDVERVRVIKGGASRELSKHPEQKGFWSNPTTPEAKDETASNWMSKLERVRVTTYLEKPEPPVKAEDLVMRVEYLGRGGKKLGFIELAGRPPQAGAEQSEFCVRTEHTRWYATILRSSGEQLQQDIASVLAQ